MGIVLQAYIVQSKRKIQHEIILVDSDANKEKPVTPGKAFTQLVEDLTEIGMYLAIC